MTNSEKYLKDGVDLCELIRNIADYRPKLETSDNFYAKMQEFFKEQAKPTLTEDERVILRNLRDTPKYIKRDSEYSFLCYDKISKNGFIDNGIILNGYGHLFQFIKERRRI